MRKGVQLYLQWHSPYRSLTEPYFSQGKSSLNFYVIPRKHTQRIGLSNSSKMHITALLMHSGLETTTQTGCTKYSTNQCRGWQEQTCGSSRCENLATVSHAKFIALSSMWVSWCSMYTDRGRSVSFGFGISSAGTSLGYGCRAGPTCRELCSDCI